MRKITKNLFRGAFRPRLELGDDFDSDFEEFFSDLDGFWEDSVVFWRDFWMISNDCKHFRLQSLT